MQRPHVVIIGGGFGGLAAAKALPRDKVRITLLDRRNHHLFQPLLYQVATASLAPTDISEPIRGALSRRGDVSVRLAQVESIDPERRQLHFQGQTGGGVLDYDYLVVATGVRHSYFGNRAWAEHAPGLKTVSDALDIRRRMLLAFEKAEWEEDPVERQRLLTFVVVGGGPTGVELAGAVAEIATKTLRKDFRNIDTQTTRVLLVEAGDSLLSSFDAGLRDKAADQLRDLGVELRLGSPVTHVDARGVELGGERLDAGTVLWAAGVKASPLLSSLGPTDRAGRVRVQPDCSVPDHPEVFVIGDACSLEDDKGQQVPGLAPAAQQMGRHAARCVLSDLKGKPRPTFRYLDKGAMATIGHHKAILESGPVKMAGVFAWLAWVFVHLVTLINFRDRMGIFVKWAWAWLSWDRAGRLVWEEGEGRLEPPDQDADRPAA